MKEETTKKKPRIAFIVPDKIEAPVGGMGVQAKYLFENLKSDFDFDFYAFPENNGLENYYSVTNPLPTIQHGGIRGLVIQTAYLSSILTEKKPDIIHASDYTVYLAGILASRSLKVPLVVSVQLSAHLMEEIGIFNAFNPNEPDGRAIQNAYKQMELVGLNEAKKIIHVSKKYKEIFSRIPGLDEKSLYIPNGVNLKEWKKSEPITLPGKRKIKLVYLGRFASQKNTHNLLSANVPENIDLIFVGSKEDSDPELFKRVIEKAKTQSNVHYYGPAYGQDKINVLSAADAIIIPSIHECHPIIMHEALASKSVVLSSFVGDMSVVLDESFAINCGVTKESIEQALIKLSNLNEKECSERIEKGFSVVQAYDWKFAAEKTKKVYEEILKTTQQQQP